MHNICSICSDCCREKSDGDILMMTWWHDDNHRCSTAATLHDSMQQLHVHTTTTCRTADTCNKQTLSRPSLCILSLPSLWVIFLEHNWNKQYLLFRYKVKIQNVKMWQVSIINFVVSWYSCNENINYQTVSLIIILTFYCNKTD